MNDQDIAIKVDHVYKDFVLPVEKVNSVKGYLTGLTKGSLSKQKTSHRALTDIDFEVKKGEFFGIVGRNGSGKSTLLKIIAGIYQPTKGKVIVNGKIVSFIELGVGFNPELSGRENVFLNGAMLGFSRNETEEMYESIVDFAEIRPFMDQKLKNYSSGMQIRLAFSMAIRAKSDIMIFDEVLAVGDSDFQTKCFDYFNQIKDDKSVTVIFISHSMDAVREYCSRAMLIENSEIKIIGSTNKVTEGYLKLFSDNQENDKKAKDADRWGNHSATIKKVSTTINNNYVELSFETKFNKDFEQPVFSIRIRESSGTEITGTNTKLEHIKTKNFKKNQSTTVSFKFPNIFRDGEYIVDVAVLYNNGQKIAEWWNESHKFKVKKEKRINFMVDPGFEIKFS
jgi:ABC-2 type transport system ATP-binding protein